MRRFAGFHAIGTLAALLVGLAAACSSADDAEGIAGSLENRLIGAMHFVGGAPVSGAPPAEHAADGFPQSNVDEAPSKLIAGASFTFVLQAEEGAAASDVSGAAVAVDGADQWIRVAAALEDGRMVLTGTLGDVAGLEGRDFNLRFALLNAAGQAGNYSTWQTRVQPLGTGDVQVTLRWSNDWDLDLFVVDPNGFTVNYGDSLSPEDGELDTDFIPECGSGVVEHIENIYWPEGRAPRGTYAVDVVNSGSCDGDAASFTVSVKIAGGRAQTYSGSINAVESRTSVTSFSY